MDSPIIILVFWVIINILLKSSRDKKKAEQARRKTGQGSPQDRQKPPDSQTMKKSTGTKNFRSALEEYKAQIERELNPEKKAPLKPEPQRTVRREPEKSPRPNRNLEKSPLKTYREGRFWKEDETEDPSIKQTEMVSLVEESTEEREPRVRSRRLLDVRNDILKGVIYAEILDKPKSIKHRGSPF
ncbi:MAG: hypothetical protein ACQEP4_00105 [Bacillota bacterium]